MKTFAKRITAWALSIIIGFHVVPMAAGIPQVSADSATNFVTNGDFENTTWYQMPAGWDTNVGYIYNDFDGNSHYSSQTCANSVSPSTYIKENVGVDGSAGVYFKSSDASSGNYSFSYKDSRGYTAIANDEVVYDYILGCDYHTPTGVIGGSIGFYFRSFLYHSGANMPMNTATSTNLAATEGYTKLQLTTSRKNCNKPSNPLVFEFGLRNATEGNELYYDNVYCSPDVLKPGDTSDTALKVLANAEWYQEVPLSAATREYFFNARMAGADAVIQLQQYTDTEAIGDPITIPSVSTNSSVYAAIEQQTITMEEDATKIKITLKNVTDSIAASYFDDIELSAENTKPLDITPISVPNFFRENMVLQRGDTHTLWGKGEPGEIYNVTLTDGNNNTSASQVKIAEDGTWKLELDGVPAQLEPYTLTLEHTTKSDILKIENVYVGDVFLLAGQSNMVYSKNYNGTQSDVLINPNIKYVVLDDVKSNTQTFDVPLQSGFSKWAELSEENQNSLSKELSIIGMNFAQNLFETQPDIPIGLINAPWGGTEISLWLKDGAIFNNHIYPFANFDLSGILWYQGCQDGATKLRTVNYSTRFTKMIDYYRSLFGTEDLPFLYVQLARYDASNYFGEIRSIQTSALDQVQNTSNIAMVTSLDTDQGTGPGNIHPLGKELLAERLCNNFKKMRHDTDAPDIVSGPLVANAALQNPDSNVVVLSFKEGTGEGLMIKNPDYSTAQDGSGCSNATELEEFEIAGVDKRFVDAQAVINGNTVLVSAEGITKPVYVRYAADSAPANPNLANEAGLPAPSFTIKVSGSDTSPEALGNQDSSVAEGMIFDETRNDDGSYTVTLKPKAWDSDGNTNYAEVFVNESDTNNHYNDANLIIGRRRTTLINYVLSDFFKGKTITNVSLTLKKYNNNVGGNRKLIVKKMYDNTWASSLANIQTITSKNVPLDNDLDYEILSDEIYLEGSADKTVDLTHALKTRIGDMKELSLQLSAEELFGDTESEAGASIAKGETTLSITYYKESSGRSGDMNNDSKITSVDALLLLKKVNGNTEHTTDELSTADVDGDGSITTRDVLYVLQYASGEITEFPS